MPEPGTPPPKGGQGTELVPGSVVGAGRFSLVKELGRGGMGVVWLAADQRLNEWVALKLLPPEIAGDAEVLGRMREETFKSRRLTHPNIIRIHDLYEAKDETPFISMEFVDGPSLWSLLGQQPGGVFAWDTLVPVVRQLCDALHYAHGEGVIHRDLKPANLMLDNKGRLKLADFGIAVLQGDAASREEAMKARSGTPAFMSPQQLDGEPPQASDDIYALGATLYMLLVSQPPFYQGDVFAQVRSEPAPPPQRRLDELGKLNHIPIAVSSTLLDCLSKNPVLRPPGARAVAERLGIPMESSAGDASPEEGDPRLRSHRSMPELPPGAHAVVARYTSPSAYKHEVLGSRDGKVTVAQPGLNWRRIAALSTAGLIVAGLGVWLVKRPSSTGGGSTGSLKAPAQFPNIALPAALPKLPWTNSLGMTFRTVRGAPVLFSVVETRVRDFELFTTETGHEATHVVNVADIDTRPFHATGDGVGWRRPGFTQGPDHAVCNVSWNDAMAFCRWLTARDRTAHLVATNVAWRLPTEAEWRAAAGLPPAAPVNAAAPKPPSVFAWGAGWPPPAATGNFAGKESAVKARLGSYADGFPRTAPVGSFMEDRNGLLDLSGNVAELVMDWEDQLRRGRVVLGASWLSGTQAELDLAHRTAVPPHVGLREVGFRIVLAVE